MSHVTLTVNGAARTVEIEPRELLVYVLRERLGLTGTNVGCDTSSCGACTVLLDGESVKSCTVLGVQADGAEITTIEGLAGADGSLHPVQQAFHEHHALQCGYCTPGMVMAAVSLIDAGEAGSEEQIRARARREPVPVHRIPQHRQGRRRPPRRWRHERHRDKSYRHGRCCARRTGRCSPVAATFVDNMKLPGTVAWSSCAARTPTRASAASTSPPPARPRASSPRSPAPTCRTSGRRRCPAPGR